MALNVTRPFICLTIIMTLHHISYIHIISSNNPYSAIKTFRCAITSIVLVAGLLFSHSLLADPVTSSTADSGATLDEVLVFARGETLIGAASAASEGAVGGDDLLVRPMLRVADLLEAVPGMIA